MRRRTAVLVALAVCLAALAAMTTSAGAVDQDAKNGCWSPDAYSGALTSPPFTTGEAASIAFQGWFEIEAVDPFSRDEVTVQYDLNGCCLRAPWIMEKDDFKYQLSFGEDVFGGPRWRDLVGAEAADAYVESRTVPIMLDQEGRPVKRNFVHVDDLVDAILAAIDCPAARRQTFNVCMNEPVDYGELGAYLGESRGLPSVGVRTPYFSTWLDNAKARFLLGWQPQYDLKRMTDAAWDYQRPADEPRVVWYPG